MMKHLLYFVLLVFLWITFIPAFNSLTEAPAELRIWFVAINVVVTIKLIVDIHTTMGMRGPRGYAGKDGLDA